MTIVMTNELRLNDWITAVHTELDSYGYDLLVDGYDPRYIAQGMSTVMARTYSLGYSHRLCALMILGITYEIVIFPAKNQTIN